MYESINGGHSHDVVWARCCQGLLPIEMESIVYWASVESSRCLELLNDLIVIRDVAMHRIREPPDNQVSAAENTRIHEEMVTNFYLSSSVAR